MYHLEENLQPDEMIIQGDFAEDYSIMVQDEIQSYHWENSQVTLHPFVLYYPNNDGKLLHESTIMYDERQPGALYNNCTYFSRGII